MYRTILMTGAGSGFGEGTAIGLAQRSHNVIAAVQTWPQVSALRNKAESAKLSALRVEKLDLLDPHDVAHALSWEFDVLVNNAGIGEGGPIGEIPMDLVRQNFEVNVFAPLDFTQRVVKRWVKSKTQGKVVFVSSVLGVLSPPMVGAYSATKHAVQAIAEAMQDELLPFGIQVQTINPGPFLTGFNETMVEAGYRWLDDKVNFTSRAMVKEVTDGLLAKPEGRLNPNDMIAKMIELIPQQKGPFRNIFPEASQDWFREYERAMLERTI
jgi:NAD(P)-dependent dehydrogenase (short-subunit alcohol dehydrogenase family)